VDNPAGPIDEWIRSAAIPLATVEPGHGFGDIEPFRRLIGDARIVSLGEATHGTREFFQLKHRLLAFCVAELGFTMLGIEAKFAPSLAVNAYVLGGIGNVADALAGLGYWIWDTEEVSDAVTWMRWWNANHARKVKFYGFVTGSPAGAALGLIDFLARVAPDLAATCRTELAPLTSDLTALLFGQLPAARRAAILDCVARVLAAFVHHRAKWVAATSVTEWHLGRLHAVDLDRSARFAADPGAADHDRAMADNVCALLDAEGPGAKAVLWSHNYHASRSIEADGYKSMGQHLDETFGRGQVVVGTSFDRGAFQARDYPTGALADHSVGPAAAETFDAVLAQAGRPLFALDLASAPHQGAVAAWLAAEIPMRSIGGIFGFEAHNRYGVVYAQTVAPRRQFDVVAFIAETTAARRNQPGPPRPPAPAQSEPTNLDLSGEGVPAGWRMVGGARRHAHVAGASDERSPSGGRTVRLARAAAPWRWGDGRLVQKIAAKTWRGGKLRFAAAVRTEVADLGAGALLFVTFLQEPDRSDESDFFAAEIAVVASSEAPVRSAQWTTLAVETDVPPETECFLIGLALCGSGAAWFGDLQLTAIMHSD
jgi:erythromycin esterase